MFRYVMSMKSWSMRTRGARIKARYRLVKHLLKMEKSTNEQ